MVPNAVGSGPFIKTAKGVISGIYLDSDGLHGFMATPRKHDHDDKDKDKDKGDKDDKDK